MAVVSLRPLPAGPLALAAVRQVPALGPVRALVLLLLCFGAVALLCYCALTLLRPPEQSLGGGGGEARQGNLWRTCGVCQQDAFMETLIPCGHMLCGDCRSRILGGAAAAPPACPFCRSAATGALPVFQP
mmetsp:Transcript_84695/g.221196  ORF Transcript_84695/g.221196 Transcript_84695/m.221196 type:complete len:130 (+) Transcript_84695:78-467(+)